jgi:hypothetical protein
VRQSRLWLAFGRCRAERLGGLLAQPSVFVIDFMQTQRHLSAPAANLILVSAGALAIPVLVGAGAISDRLGRNGSDAASWP